MKYDLRNIPTTPPKGVDKNKCKKQALAYANVIGDLTTLFKANKEYSLLIIFQGMDASGKDGSVRSAFHRSSPLNLKVTGFGKPTDLEASHDFLWRIHPHTPAKGNIAIWNRSHYEDVLIQRVHNWIDKKTVKSRFEAINAFEKNLVKDNNTIILKFLLHVSYEEQEKQLQERIDEFDKHYKHNPNDWEERKHWDKYMDAYNDVLNKSEIPWHIVPTDKRWYRDFLVSKTVMETLENLDLKWPPLEK